MNIKRNDVYELLAGLILGYAGIMIIIWTIDILHRWRRWRKK